VAGEIECKKRHQKAAHERISCSEPAFTRFAPRVNRAHPVQWTPPEVRHRKSFGLLPVGWGIAWQRMFRGRLAKTEFRKTKMTKYEGIVPALAQALEKHGYVELTSVQKAVLSSEIGQADALVSAQTGSGKTVAFGLALAPTLLGEAERFSHAGVPLALAIAPTRELALQVARELEWLYEFTGATVATCVGGMDMRNERRALERGAHIVVGTPGRLRDHITRHALNMTGLKAVVLDEADEMLDLGFREDLEFILDAAPADRRTLMFSATVPRAIATLA
jgi:ATP-dependent RNA helicase DeaD